MFEFKIIKRDKKARTGGFKTPHGTLLTPELAFVATDGYIRGVPNKTLKNLPINYTISNTFHTFTKNLVPKIEKAGGINKYMGYKKVSSTDSGGFQVFSLGFGKVHGVGKIAPIFPEKNTKEKGLLITRDRDNLLHITEEGVMFNYDKGFLLFTPEMSIDIQKRLGADIIFALDECTSPLNSYTYTRQAMERTHRWLKRCVQECNKGRSDQILRNPRLDESGLKGRGIGYRKNFGHETFRQTSQQALFGVIQGGYFEDLRKISAKFVSGQDVQGFGIGGSLGRDKKDMLKILEWVNPHLPEDKPRHLFGIGQVRDIFESVERGIDLFDCVIPTREARHRILYTKKGKLNVRKMKTVSEVPDKDCACQMCSNNITMKNLNNLFLKKDPQAFFYATVHNIQFFADLMNEIRDAINQDNFGKVKEKYFLYY